MPDQDASGLHAKVLTVSDGVMEGTRDDTSGAVVADVLEAAGWNVLERHVVADGRTNVIQALKSLAYHFDGLIVTTGGTGFGPRDQTPEGTLAVLSREAPGLAEAMRAASPLGRLSRGVAGTRGRTVILNTPGSTAGARESLEAVLDVLPHAVRLVIGEPTPH